MEIILIQGGDKENKTGLLVEGQGYCVVFFLIEAGTVRLASYGMSRNPTKWIVILLNEAVLLST